MKSIIFHLDFVSPYAWLAFDRLPQALEGLSYAVDYRPLLLGAVIRHWGHKAPAEVEPKRQWVFRHVAWLAAQQGTPLAAPAVHPFDPLPLLRLALACGPNRRVCEAIFRHVWDGGGADALDPGRLAALTGRLAPARDPAAVEVKAELRRNTDEAIAQDVFGVPAFRCDGRTFWGLDGLPMLRDALAGGTWFDDGVWEREGRPRPGFRRGTG